MGDLRVAIYEGSDRPARFWALLGPMFASAEVAKALDYHMKDDPDHTWFVATRGSALAGFCCAINRKGHVELAHLYCREDAAHGVLAGAREDWLREHRPDLPWRTTVKEGERAALEASGWECASRRGGYVSMRKENQPC